MANPPGIIQGATHLQLALKELGIPYTSRSGPDKDGSRTKRYHIYKPSAVFPASECEHQTTICNECYDQWATDYDIRDFGNHGDQAYQKFGCRCEVCITSRSRWMSDRQITKAWAINARLKVLAE